MANNKQKREKLFQGIADKSPGMIYVCRGRYLIYVNEKFEGITGYRREDLCSGNFDFMALIHPDSKNMAEAIFVRQANGESLDPYELKLITKHGRELTVINSTKPIDLEGKGAVLGIITDITDHKLAEDAVLDIAKIVSTGVGEEFFYSMARHLSRVLKSDYAYVAEVVPGKTNVARTLALIADGEFIDNLEVDIAGTPCETVRGKQTCSYPCNVRELFPDAHIMAELKVEGYAGTSLFDSSGKHLGLITVMYRKPIKNVRIVESMLQIFASRVSAEIERRHAEKALKKSETRLQESQHIAHIGSWEYDVVNNHLWWSDEVYSIFGLNCQETDLSIDTFMDAVHPDDRAKLNEQIQSGLSYRTDYRIVRSDRSVRYIHEEVRMVKDGDGNPQLIWGTAQDITDHKLSEAALKESEQKYRKLVEQANSDRKKTEAALIKHHEHLEELVEDRTHALLEVNKSLQDEVKVRKKVEKKLLEHQKQLRSLSSQLSLIEENEKRRVATELHDCIGQTLALSKIKLGLLSKATHSSDTKKNIREILQLIEQTIKETRTLTFELSPPILYELGLSQAIKWLIDQFRDKHALNIDLIDDGHDKPFDNNTRFFLFQAVRELLINVVKHAQATNVTIRVKRVDGKLNIVIEDNGKGFARPSVKYDGYGLFNIRERMNHINGQFEIESLPGHGTRVTLVAPLMLDH
jgi:PAS domain S-box-containing protein